MEHGAPGAPELGRRSSLTATAHLSERLADRPAVTSRIAHTRDERRLALQIESNFVGHGWRGGALRRQTALREVAGSTVEGRSAAEAADDKSGGAHGCDWSLCTARDVEV